MTYILLLEDQREDGKLAQITIKVCTLIKVISTTFALSFTLGLLTAKMPLVHAQETFLGQKFTREETMLLNLSHGKGSAGFFLLEAERLQKDITHNLERAMSQIEQVEKAYARSKGKPDDKYLASTELKLVNARQRSEELSEHISNTFRDMKRTVKDALLR